MQTGYNVEFALVKDEAIGSGKNSEKNLDLNNIRMWKDRIIQHYYIHFQQIFLINKIKRKEMW